MHDSQLEDRLRAVLRAESDALPLTITPEELERQLALRRRERVGRRITTVVAGIAAVLVVALAAPAIGWFRAADVGSGPSARPSDLASDGPIAVPSAEPSEGTLSCMPINPTTIAQPPAVILGVSPGDAIAQGGRVSSFKWGDVQTADAGSWNFDTIPFEPIHVGPASTVQVLAGGRDVCLVGLAIDAKPYEDLAQAPVAIAGSSSPPTRLLDFAPPRDGDWLILVHAAFETTDGSEAWSETLFHLGVGDATGIASPLPATLPELPIPEGTILSDEASAIDRTGEPTGVVEVIGFAPVQPRSIYQVDVVCLGFAPVRWSLGLEGEFGFMAAGDQACDGRLGSHTLELGIPPRDVPVFIQADPATAWHVLVSSIGTLPPFLPAALRAWPTVDPDGAAAAAEANGHCVSSAFGADQCGPAWETARDARRIRISSSDNVTFRLEDGWDIAQARVTAIAAGTFDPEYSVGFIDTASPEVVIPIELDPGHWTVQMSLNARRGTEFFGAWYNFALEVAE